MDKPVCVKEFDRRPEAEIAAAALKAEGVHAVVYGDDANLASIFDKVTGTPSVHLMVERSEAAKAAELLGQTKERGVDGSLLYDWITRLVGLGRKDDKAD